MLLQVAEGRTGRHPHGGCQQQRAAYPQGLRQQFLEPKASLGCAAALALILVDHFDLRGGPAEIDGAVHQRVLTLCRFPIVDYLMRCRWPDVDDGRSLQMTSLHFVERLGRITSSGHATLC
jgi:hypothetical protein